MKTFSVLTWNLNSRTNTSVINEQIKLIKTHSPDIVTLQEITINSVQKITTKLEELGYQYIINSFEKFEKNAVSYLLFIFLYDQKFFSTT